MRLYKLSRIKNLVVKNEHFSDRDLPNVSGNPTQNSYKEEQKVTLKLRIDPQMAYRVFDVFYEGMVEKHPDGRFTVTVTWPEDNWLYSFLLSFGKYIEVLEPEHIRDIIRDHAEKIIEKYL